MPSTLPPTPASLAHTSVPSASAGRTPSASPIAGPAPASIDELDAVLVPRRDLVTLAHAYGRTQSRARVVRTTPLPDQVGTQTDFWVWDWSADRFYTTTATLHLALDHVLMYVENGLAFALADLEHAARDFNDRIYPRTRALFGSEWTPGIDGDARITILNAHMRGAGGYFSITDEVPRSAMRFSNEREMFYMNVASLPLGPPAYRAVLAHELQHMIAWPHQQQATTWLNEGLSELAEQLNRYQPLGDAEAFLRAPDLPLTGWGDKPDVSAAHYTAAYLFLAYAYERHGTALDLQQLVRDGAGKRLDRFAEQFRKERPSPESFDALFADWAVANLIDEADVAAGRWSYPQLPHPVQPVALDATTIVSDVAQYGADYLRFPPASRPRVLHFDGSDQVGIVPARPEGGVSWWSNRGDDMVTTLTGAFDLTPLQAATLQFRIWYDLQADYDYGFVSASTDGGSTWRTLPGRYTTTEDPAGANYGYGYTGMSGTEQPDWRDEVIDLTRVAGQQVLIRFSVVNDDSVHHQGMLVDAMRIPELDFEDDAEQAHTGWQAAGWVRTNNRLPQRWQLRLVRLRGASGDRLPQVEPIMLDRANRARVHLAADERAVLVVMATTPHSSERAHYVITPAGLP